MKPPARPLSQSPTSWGRMVVLGGTALFVLGAFLLGRRDWGGGFFFGTLASLFNFWGLERLVQKTLAGDSRKSLAFFWFFNLTRWLFFFLVCWFFWRVSPRFFLGGSLGYFWCLSVFLAGAWSARKRPEK
ncbi:MAG: ATP synthase subunit I [bacterium]